MEKQIYYHDTDAGGVVYYANYLKYLEEARTEFFEARGLGIAPFLARGYVYAVRSCNIVYLAPARYGDKIIAEASIAKITGARIFFKQTVRERVTGKLLAEADITLVCLDTDFRPRPIPADIKEKLQ